MTFVIKDPRLFNVFYGLSVRLLPHTWLCSDAALHTHTPTHTHTPAYVQIVHDALWDP